MVKLRLRGKLALTFWVRVSVCQDVLKTYVGLLPKLENGHVHDDLLLRAIPNGILMRRKNGRVHALLLRAILSGLLWYEMHSFHDFFLRNLEKRRSSGNAKDLVPCLYL